MHEKHRKLIGRLDLMEARLAKIEAMLEGLLQREAASRLSAGAARTRLPPLRLHPSHNTVQRKAGIP